MLNPSLIACESGYLLALRVDAIDPILLTLTGTVTTNSFWGKQTIALVETDHSFHGSGRKLETAEGQDPRLFRAMGQLWLAFSTLPRQWRQWLMPIRTDHHFEQLGEPILPNHDLNTRIVGGDQKNWTWIDRAPNSIDCIQWWEPFTVLRFDETGCCCDRYRDDTVILSWEYGKIHGGTPSVLLPCGLRFSVFQSHLHEPRTYYVGGMFHEPEWPYRPIKLLNRPLIVGGNQPRRWPNLSHGDQNHKVAFPCGLVAKLNSVLVSYGVNNCVCAVAEFSYDELKDYDTRA